MRRFILALLLATAAASPALAQSTPDELRAGTREQARAERAVRAEARPDRGEWVQDEHVQAPEQSLVPRAAGQFSRPAIERAIERGRPSTVADRPPQTIELRRGPRDSVANWGRERLDTRDSVANWRREQREQLRQFRGDGLSERALRRRVTPPANARPDRPAPRPRTAARQATVPQWHSSWRDDRRYDWRDHRRRFGSLFRPGFYFDPFGWNYRRYGVAWRLWPSYYERSYWLNNPFMYRLPYAPYPYKWVRYWDDALLVDIYSGQVVDVSTTSSGRQPK